MFGISRLLLLFILVVLVLRALRQLARGMVQGMEGRPRGHRPPEQGVQMVRDPVCGVFLVPSRALVLEDRGQARYFCSEKCRSQYQIAAASRARSAR